MMIEKIAKIFFYLVKTLNFSKLLLSDDKNFLKDTQNSKKLTFVFCQKMKIDENNFSIEKAEKLYPTFFGTEEVLDIFLCKKNNVNYPIEICSLAASSTA